MVTSKGGAAVCGFKQGRRVVCGVKRARGGGGRQCLPHLAFRATRGGRYGGWQRLPSRVSSEQGPAVSGER